MKSLSLFYIIVIAGSIICLFIPFWFAPFFISLAGSCFFEASLKKSMLVHLCVYAAVCAGYCLYAYNTGSKELVGMIGEIFKGISFVMMMILSSIFYGVTAMMGAWVGGVLKIKN